MIDMAAQDYSPQHVLRIARDGYEPDNRALVEPLLNGKFLAIDIETGEYEVDDLDVNAVLRLRARNADPRLYIHRIGEAAAYHIGVHSAGRRV